MANFNGYTLTAKGHVLQVKAQAGEPLVYTKIKVGSGYPASGQNITDLTDLIKPEMDLPGVASEAVGDGTAMIKGVLSNAGLQNGFTMREKGVFALDPDDGEILYAYTTSGIVGEDIPAEGGPTAIEREIYAVVTVGQATNIQVFIKSGAWITIEELQKYTPKKDFDDHILINRVRQNNEPVKVGDIRYPSRLDNPSWAIFKCEKAGTTGTVEPTITAVGTLQDGSVTWQILNATNLGGGVPTGTIIAWGGLTAPAGYLECAGQSLSRATYGALFKAIGTVWGTTTADNFKLPDFKTAARFLRSRGDGLEVGTVQGDAIRNIKGDASVATYGGLGNGALATATGTNQNVASGSGGWKQTLGSVVGGSADKDFLDISRVVPTADENRPKSAVVMYCIKATDEYINPDQVDLAKVAEEIAECVKYADFTQSFSENGWTQLPNGLILQWGENSNHSVKNLFPIAFPNRCFGVSITTVANSTSIFGQVGTAPFDKFGFTNYHTRNNTGTIVTATYTWFAIGY